MGVVAVLGSSGQLGTDVVGAFREAGSQVHPLAHAEVDVADARRLREVLAARHPDVIINCAAYVDVDRAEEEPEAAFRVNAIGALHVARSAAALSARCVQVSTDYVFDGEQETPYTEEDAPRPLSVYGASKLAGEHLVRLACPQALIVRVAGLFGAAGVRGKAGNFIDAILAKANAGAPLKVVRDVRVSPTYTRDAARGMVELIGRGADGLVHLTNAGACTWHELATRVVELCRLPVRPEPIPQDAYPTRARRPRNSALASARLTTLIGHPLPPWPDAVQRYLAEKGCLGRAGATRG